MADDYKTLEDYYLSIPYGSDNAISRLTLTNKWNMSDRKVRRMIHELRATDNGDKTIIVSSSRAKGYFRTNDHKEIEMFRRELYSRSKKIFAPFKKIDRILGVSEFQGELFGGSDDK